MITGGWDFAIKIWHVSNRRILRKIIGHKDKILCLLLLEKNSYEESKTTNSETKLMSKEFGIISLGKEKVIRFWPSNS